MLVWMGYFDDSEMQARVINRSGPIAAVVFRASFSKFAQYGKDCCLRRVRCVEENGEVKTHLESPCELSDITFEFTGAP